jgi:hypothetical protein
LNFAKIYKQPINLHWGHHHHDQQKNKMTNDDQPTLNIIQALNQKHGTIDGSEFKL